MRIVKLPHLPSERNEARPGDLLPEVWYKGKEIHADINQIEERINMKNIVIFGAPGSYAAYAGEELAGILRAVGDGSTVVFIQDILVLSRYRRKGIGTALVRAVLERFPNVRQIQLTADDTPGARAFYASLGFRELSRIGCAGFIRMGN